MNKFYNCFTNKNTDINHNIDIVKIEITTHFTSLIEIFDYFGHILYQDNPEKNMVSKGTYFGKNIDAFYDCLKTYFLK